MKGFLIPFFFIQLIFTNNLFSQIPNIENRDKTYSPLSLFLIIDQDLEKDKKIIKDYFDTILSIRGIDKEDLNLIRLKKPYSSQICPKRMICLSY